MPCWLQKFLCSPEVPVRALCGITDTKFYILLVGGAYALKDGFDDAIFSPLAENLQLTQVTRISQLY
jgi:hypothetical protein